MTLLVAGLMLWWLPTRAEQRLEAVTATAPPTDWSETIVSIAGPLANLSTPEGGWENSPLRIRFNSASVSRTSFGADST